MRIFPYRGKSACPSCPKSGIHIAMMPNSRRGDIAVRFSGHFSIFSSYSDELDLMSNQLNPPTRDTASRAQRQPVKDCNVSEIDLDVGRLTDAELASRLALARARIETSFFNTFRSS